MSAPTMTDLEHGSYLVGQYVDGRDGREWTGKDGITRQPFEVTILMGRSAMRIEYRTPADAMAALVNTAKGETVVLRVFSRINKDRLYYSGVGARPVADA
jgi:hypothetical protein